MTLIVPRILRAPGSPEVSVLHSRLWATLQGLLEPTSSAESVRPGGRPPKRLPPGPWPVKAKALNADRETTQLLPHPHPLLTPALAEKTL